MKLFAFILIMASASASAAECNPDSILCGSEPIAIERAARCGFWCQLLAYRETRRQGADPILQDMRIRQIIRDEHMHQQILRGLPIMH